MKQLIATAAENRLETIGAIAAVIVCVAIVFGVAHEQRYGDAGTLYTVENGKWFAVSRHSPVRSE